MKIETMDVKTALERGLALPFALVRSLSTVTLGPTPETVNEAELLEARFFDADREIRVFRGVAGLQAACLTAEEGDHTLERKCALSNPQFGKTVTLCRQLEFDEDGQAYVSASRLTGWEGGQA